MTRTPVAMLLAALMIFGVAACGDDEKADSSTELQSDGKQGDSADDSSSDDTSSDDTDTSLPDLGDLDDLEDLDMGNLEECMSIGVTYAGLALSVLGGEDAAKEALGEVDELKTKFPDELEDDLDVVADAYAKVAEDGFIEGGEAMETDEFKEADANIQAYLEEACGGG